MSTKLLLEQPEKQKAFNLAIYKKVGDSVIEIQENLNERDALACGMEALKGVLEGKIGGFQLFEKFPL